MTGPSSTATALPDVGDHRAEDDQGGDADHGEDHAVDEGDDHQVVAGRECLLEVVQQHEVLRPGELQQRRLDLVLEAMRKMKANGTRKKIAVTDDGGRFR